MSLSRRELLERSIKLRRRERQHRHYLWIGVVIGILTLVLLVVLVPWFRVKTVTVEGNKVVPTSEILNLVTGVTAGRYFYLIPKDHIFWYPTGFTSNHLLTVLPRLGKAEITRRNFNEVVVRVVERAPAALWCVGEERANCFFIDQAGLVYAPAPWFSSALFFEIIGTTSPQTFPTETVPAIYVRKLTRFAAAAPALLAATSSEVVRFESAELWPQGDAVFTVKQYNVLAGGAPLTWHLRINLDQDLMTAGRNLSSVWHSNAFQKEFGANRTKLDYLDVRFGNKVFYKFKTNE